MSYWIQMLVISSTVFISACAPHVHTLQPEKATAGHLQHGSDGDGKLQLTYDGKSYSGEFEAEPSRRIHGEHQRHPGRVARSILVAPDGDKLTCDVQWANAGKPAGTCTDETGASFSVRFD